MPKWSEMVTIMFADIAGSTRLYDKLGDVPARELIALCIDQMITAIHHHRGTVVKTIGDEVLCTFSTPDDAAAAAISQHELMSSHERLFAHHMQLRIGFHHGSIVAEEGDVFGDAVNVAARVVEQTKGGQILTTGTTLNLLGPKSRSTARLVDQTRVKGKRDIIDLYELSWGQPEELTLIGTVGQNFSKPADSHLRYIHLSFMGQEYRIDHNRPSITMGRDSGNTITINEPRVSRLHAHIELRRDQYFIVDRSTNGTFLLAEKGPALMLRRDEIQLPENGGISLGHEADPQSPLVIRFHHQSV